jgi:septal ring factor EnvC (AmiA/AmiB activator)
MTKKTGYQILTATALAALLGACATSKTVDQKIAEAQAQTSKKIESVEGQVEDLQTKQKATDTHLSQNDAAIAQLSQEFSDILRRPIERTTASSGERQDGDVPELPRLRLDFDRSHFGRLRQLIDRLNEA